MKRGGKRGHGWISGLMDNKQVFSSLNVQKLTRLPVCLRSAFCFFFFLLWISKYFTHSSIVGLLSWILDPMDFYQLWRLVVRNCYSSFTLGNKPGFPSFTDGIWLRAGVLKLQTIAFRKHSKVELHTILRTWLNFSSRATVPIQTWASLWSVSKSRLCLLCMLI